MPELPEVETVCRGLSKAMTGKTISRVALARAGLRFPFPPALSRLKNVKVAGITRRAKYILIALSGGRTMIAHLGMSGRMTVVKKLAPQKHDHMVIALEDGFVVFNDPRRFGLVDLCATKNLHAHKLLKHLGPEPLDEDFSAAYLAHKFKNKNTSVKLAIMDQRVVVGVGNIYASEALFESRIHPERAAGTLTAAEIKHLISGIRKTLRAAIKAGGSSLRDYVQADGELGYFQHSWAVYDRAGEKCKGCTCESGIQKITQGQRSTFYCPEKQR